MRPVASSTPSKRLPITAIVLTYNEERNLRACLESIAPHVSQIIIADSFSTDRTLEIAREYTTHIFERRWVCYSDQYEWASQRTEIDQPWILRVDADERWTADGFDELARHMGDPTVNGIYVRMKIYFMGRWIRHGAFYPNLFLRAYRAGTGGIEQRWMDEHISVEGKTVVTDIDVIEANYDREKNLTLFIDKHNKYASREAIDLLIRRHHLGQSGAEVGSLLGTSTERKRWIKDNVYARTPLFARSLAYFGYRYVLRGGFLDGKEGFMFHALQGLWYRFLVDAKVYQLEQLMEQEGKDLAQVAREHLGYEIGVASSQRA